MKQNLKKLSVLGTNSDIKQKQAEALLLDKSMKPEAHKYLYEMCSSLNNLYQIKENMENNDHTDSPIYEKLCNKIEEIEFILNEDTSATGGPAGMGSVVNAQPSGLAGATIGTSWASHGGTEGSGDVSVPYNPSGANRVFQKVPVMGFNHGPRTGKKSRTKKLDIKSLKKMFNKKQDYTKKQDGVKKTNVMSFQDFLKNDITSVKK